MLIRPAAVINGSLTPAGDKSISHRLVLLSLLLDGRFEISGLSDCDDVRTSIDIVRQLGVSITGSDDRIILTNYQPFSRRQPRPTEIFCGNSGTTARLLTGILPRLPGEYRLFGDPSLSRRPMQRVVIPLREMGAEIHSENDFGLPVRTRHSPAMRGINHVNQKASAQVKSAILLAALGAAGSTVTSEPYLSRNHTELLFRRLGIAVSCDQNRTTLVGPQQISGNHVFSVPGDISSAAFFIVAAAMIPGSRLLARNLLLNPCRTGFIKVLQRMGADLEIVQKTDDWEACGDIKVRGGSLRGTEIFPDEIPALIDELPALAAAMCFAEGTSRVTGAAELRHKESDRIAGIVKGLQKTGIDCRELDDGFEIKGSFRSPDYCELDSLEDHRLAMAFSLLGLKSQRGIFVDNCDCVKISCPDFFAILNAICC
jgi:3-phosphoshikimate 1-carboxyvinyltransferase